MVVFDFLGKDSIRYYNEVEVDKRVYKNLKLFCENKKEGDELFDRLNVSVSVINIPTCVWWKFISLINKISNRLQTGILNKHLNELMEGLTAKVFRTYNASITLQNQLRELTDPNATVAEKVRLLRGIFTANFLVLMSLFFARFYNTIEPTELLPSYVTINVPCRKPTKNRWAIWNKKLRLRSSRWPKPRNSTKRRNVMLKMELRIVECTFDVEK